MNTLKDFKFEDFLNEASIVSHNDNYICEETSDRFIFGDNIFSNYGETDNIRTIVNKIRDIDNEEILHFFQSEPNIRFQPSELQLTYLCWLRKTYGYKFCVIQKRSDITRVLENRYIINIDGLNYLIFTTDEPDVIYGISTKSQIIDGERYRNILKLEMDDNNYELKASELDDAQET